MMRRMTHVTGSLARPTPLAPAVESLRTATPDQLLHTLDGVLEQIEACEPRLRALLPEEGRAARLHGQAHELADRYPDPAQRPPLFGVLVGVKDIIAVDGLPTRAGSALPAEAFMMPEAVIVRRLRAAGALVLGKTVTAEFASRSPNGTTNPHHPGHTPGGSSSGSAAGVAAGYFPLALATQTGGSVIRPASFCGIIGFKPSYGRIPTDGVLDHARSVDTLGVYTQDMAGIAIAAAVVADAWQPAPERHATELVLGVPDGAYLDLAEQAGRDAFEGTVARLATLGVQVRRVPFLDDVEAVLERHSWLMLGEFAEAHRDRFARWGPLYSGSAAGDIDRGRAITEEQRRIATDGMAGLRARVDALLDEHGLDALACPAAPGPAPAGLGWTGNPAMNAPWTHAGVPAITLPSGHVGALPVGLQLVGRFGQDEALVATAAALHPLL